MGIFGSDRFRTWITCASYALLNILNCSDIDVVELENSTGVTFGVASYSEQYHCTRMLTPYRTFWDGLESVRNAFGIHLECFSFSDGEELIKFIHAAKDKSFIIGPLNMSSLYYLPVCSQYKCADHYIALHMKGDDMYLTDPEGIPHMRIYEADLKRILNINDIMEAKGKFHAAFISHRDPMPDNIERASVILKSAGKVFCEAEQNGQGGNAFLICRRIMKEVPASRWAAMLYYDLNYYMQRKYMFLMADNENIFLKSEFKEHIAHQIAVTRKCLSFFPEKAYLNAADMMPLLFEEETKIPYKWKEWTEQIW